MKLKLPATNMSYVILNVKYTIGGVADECNMHMENDNQCGDVEITVPEKAEVTTVTMNEVTEAQKVVSSQTLYERPEVKKPEVKKPEVKKPEVKEVKVQPVQPKKKEDK